jgi:hypothetical protein
LITILIVEDYQRRGRRGMISRFKIMFTEPTEVEFINPDTMRKEWYKCYYGHGTSVEVADILSGNTRHVFAICTDGEIMLLDAKTICIQNI